MSLVTRTVRYDDRETECHGFLAFDDALAARRGTVMIAHAWEGRNRFVEEKAVALARLGYNAFAIDMYGGGRTGATPDERRALMEPVLNNRRLLTRRVTAAFDTLRDLQETRHSRIVITGYCFGGICALDLARSGVDIAGAVSFHGGLKPSGLPSAPIRAKILIFHADNDRFVTLEDFLSVRAELNAAGASWQAHVYGGVLHSFTNPEETDPTTGMAYDAAAARHCWDGLLAFLESTLS